MNLPARIPKKRKAESRWRSPAYCNFVRSFECCVPGCQLRPIEAAHVRRGSGAGVGQKPDDWHLISLCRDHHAEQHRIGEVSFEALHDIDMRELADAFANHRDNPKAMEIRRVKQERADGT